MADLLFYWCRFNHLVPKRVVNFKVTQGSEIKASHTGGQLNSYALLYKVRLAVFFVKSHQDLGKLVLDNVYI